MSIYYSVYEFHLFDITLWLGYICVPLWRMYLSSVKDFYWSYVCLEQILMKVTSRVFSFALCCTFCCTCLVIVIAIVSPQIKVTEVGMYNSARYRDRQLAIHACSHVLMEPSALSTMNDMNHWRCYMNYSYNCNFNYFKETAWIICIFHMCMMSLLWSKYIWQAVWDEIEWQFDL